MGRKKTLSCSGEKKTYAHIEEGEKYKPGTSVIPKGGGRPLSKGGYLSDLWQWHSHPKCSLQVDALNFKHCMEHVESLYLNYQNLRIYISENLNVLHKMEIWATPTHPHLRTYTNSSLASCILVQLSDLCNLGFAVHVQYGITNTCWRHVHYRGVCRGASHFPNSLIYKKSPPNCCLRAKQIWKIGNMYFWTRK